MADGTLPPFDPGVASQGYSTNLLSTAGAPVEAEPIIFAGWKKATAYNPDLRVGPGGQGDTTHSYETKERVWYTPSQFLYAFDSFSREDFLKFRNLMVAAGLVSAGADPYSVRSTYESLLSQVAAMNGSGRNISPMGYIKNLIRMNGLDPTKVGKDEDYDPFAEPEALEPFKQTTKSVYDLSADDAKATLEEAIKAKLGRAPTADELEDFINAAQQAAANNPTTTVTKFTPGDTGLEGESSTAVTQNGRTVQQTADGTIVQRINEGFSAEDVASMAKTQAMSAPDYAEYQAVATFFPAFLQMLGASTG